MGLLRMQLLHPRSPTAASSSSSTWAARLHAQNRPSFSYKPAITSAAARSSSSDDFNSRMAMSKGDLESCQWLKPTESKALGSDESPHRSSFSLSAAIDRLLSPAGDPGSGSVQPSNGSSHASASKPSRGLLNAGPVARLLDATFPSSWAERAENRIERAIFDFRFLSLFAVAGSLAGSFLCFLKGCVFIVESYAAFYAMCLRGENTGKTVLRLVEAVDVYLTGTVMLIFGMGLYGLFISNVSSTLPAHEDRALRNSSLFGMFLLQERPKWMRIASLDELKTKVGHVVVMILLVKMFERSKAVVIATGTDLLSYSISIFLTSGALLVLRHLHH